MERIYFGKNEVLCDILGDQINIAKKTHNLLFIIILIFSLIIISPYSKAATTKAAADGSFLQSSLCGFWSNARWQQEFTAMKNAGMHYLVIGPVEESSPGKITTTLYPSSLPNTEMATGGNGVPFPDVVDACLRNAQSAGIKVFIGIGMNNNWWNSPGNDSTWLYSQMNFDNKICDEVWNLYKNKYPDAFYGWYWAYEVDNISFTTQAQQNVLTTAMNMQLDHLTATNEKLPFMWCPFMNSSLGTPQAYQAMWQNVFAGLHTTAGDIFCPQDGIGAGGLNLSNLASWFSALHQAVYTKPGLIMWSDAETFQVYKSNYISGTMDRFITQLKIEQPYVDNFVTFAYCHYYSPNNIDSGFQTTYIGYLNTGSLETTLPSTPANFTAVLQADGNITLNWNASSDDIGVCGYYIFRGRTMICNKQVPRIDEGTNIATLTSFTDTGLNPNTVYTYQVQAYDFANNVSVPTSPISITTDNMNIVSHGCTYTVSMHANSNYPDTHNNKLTDGIYASNAYYADPAWVGFLTPDTILNVVIDLNHVMSVQQFMGEYLLDPPTGVFLHHVIVSVSIDDLTFTNIGTLIDSSPSDTLSSIHKYYYRLSNPVNARYVKFSTFAPDAWDFVDEYEVLSPITTGMQTRMLSDLVPAKFGLSNNYPNPFNPSTNINFEIAQSGNISLKIYNIMGQLVKTVIDKVYKSKGSYSYLVTMNDLSSGVYFYSLIQGNHRITKRMVFLK